MTSDDLRELSWRLAVERMTVEYRKILGQKRKAWVSRRAIARLRETMEEQKKP